MSLKHPLSQQTQELATTSGIYRFYDAHQTLLYIGKARNIRKRVESYFRGQHSLRINTLVRQIAKIETTVTATENEALLLESNLIKALKPRYNIILRDDKSYPYITLSQHSLYPRLSFYRGQPKDKTHYFGPYPSISAVRETLKILHKIFRVRPCQDSFFQRRSRPCMQYQINRCSAPCVQKITPEAYQADIQRVRLFLQGKDSAIISDLSTRMRLASEQLDYETAARLRDQIIDLRQIQQQQAITTIAGEADVVVHSYNATLHCVYVLPIRNGSVLDGQAYFPIVPSTLETPQEVLEAFLAQYYLQTIPVEALPTRIILAEPIADQACFVHTLSEQAGKAIKIFVHPRGDQLRWLQLAEQNATQSLRYHSLTKRNKEVQFKILQQDLGLSEPLRRLECFDISHTQGESPIAACVVLDLKGLQKTAYRRFNLKDITPGDDYAAMRQAVMRHYARLVKEKVDLTGLLLLIDGGKGQLTQAKEVLNTLKLDNTFPILAIAKGAARKPGCETLFLAGQNAPIHLAPDSPALHLLQEIRDEAHRFAITGHRAQRAKRRQHSSLEDITGIGPVRCRELLTQFGGLQGLKRANIQEISALPNFNKTLAERVYQALRN